MKSNGNLFVSEFRFILIIFSFLFRITRKKKDDLLSPHIISFKITMIPNSRNSIHSNVLHGARSIKIVDGQNRQKKKFKNFTYLDLCLNHEVVVVIMVQVCSHYQVIVRHRSLLRHMTMMNSAAAKNVKKGMK